MRSGEEGGLPYTTHAHRRALEPQFYVCIICMYRCLKYVCIDVYICMYACMYVYICIRARMATHPPTHTYYTRETAADSERARNLCVCMYVCMYVPLSKKLSRAYQLESSPHAKAPVRKKILAAALQDGAGGCVASSNDIKEAAGAESYAVLQESWDSSRACTLHTRMHSPGTHTQSSMPRR
jgi:hypothetical protein